MADVAFNIKKVWLAAFSSFYCFLIGKVCLVSTTVVIMTVPCLTSSRAARGEGTFCGYFCLAGTSLAAITEGRLRVKPLRGKVELMMMEGKKLTDARMNERTHA